MQKQISGLGAEGKQSIEAPAMSPLREKGLQRQKKSMMIGQEAQVKRSD